jgi:hypothetical protein
MTCAPDALKQLLTKALFRMQDLSCDFPTSLTGYRWQKLKITSEKLARFPAGGKWLCAGTGRGRMKNLSKKGVARRSRPTGGMVGRRIQGGGAEAA